MSNPLIIITVLLGLSQVSVGKRSLGLDKSLLSMFDAFDAAKGNSDHVHDRDEYEQLHDGQGGHDHDNDGHVHEQYSVKYHKEPRHGQDHIHHNSARDIQKLHDGPGGHHHDDDGHDHKKHKEAVTEAEENNADLRKFTLIISKLLFQLSQM
eukprot:TRINITY_DN6158_c0_g1_i1.p1 TRINITY_DN6158_c0_g1~~TRINITY_DN6158_c0_g1_i1.p1  ORF type:complete len:152 (-),score=37.00 TRINITY_DN6158_c0_g1_i1:73-528(-)